MTISRCYFYGVYIPNPAPGSLLRTNALSNLGNSTYAATVYPEAIFTSGGVRIENNSIASVTATGAGATSTGLDLLDGDFAIGNTISNCTTGISGGKYLNNLTSGVTTAFAGGTNAAGNN